MHSLLFINLVREVWKLYTPYTYILVRHSYIVWFVRDCERHLVFTG